VGPFDAAVGAVAHEAYVKMSDQELAGLLTDNGILADIKGIWRERRIAGVRRWQL